MNKLKKGIYRHYKGGEYRIVGEARSTVDDQEKMVVYESLKDSQIWLRSVQEFLSEVEVAGEKKPRFEWLREEEMADWESKYKRALADYHNLLKQTTREKQDFIKYALTDILQDILPIYDHLKMSLSGLSEEEAENAWVVGVKHVLKQFKEVLATRGVEEIMTIGVKFDHNTMEALDGTGENIKQEVLPGYKLNGRVIRPAKVIVE
ncbi:MAG: nucleotide exchange factor GrpE [Patescibacteria group bacterium]|jgi:molecular chaperone GrpE